MPSLKTLVALYDIIPPDWNFCQPDCLSTSTYASFILLLDNHSYWRLVVCRQIVIGLLNSVTCEIDAPFLRSGVSVVCQGLALGSVRALLDHICLHGVLRFPFHQRHKFLRIYYSSLGFSNHDPRRGHLPQYQGGNPATNLPLGTIHLAFEIISSQDHLLEHSLYQLSFHGHCQCTICRMANQVPLGELFVVWFSKRSPYDYVDSFAWALKYLGYSWALLQF